MNIINTIYEYLRSNPKLYILITTVLCMCAIMIIYLLGTKVGEFIYNITHWIK